MLVSDRIRDLIAKSQSEYSAISWPALRLLGLLAERHVSEAVAALEKHGECQELEGLEDALERIASRQHPYRHSSEGSDDMPAHIKSMITSTSLSIPVPDGRLALGTWQGVYLVEHRDAPHRRRVVLTFLGSSSSEAVGQIKGSLLDG